MSRTTTPITILSLLFVFATFFIMSCTSASKGPSGMGKSGLIDIFFDYDQSVVKQDAQNSLDKNAAKIINDKMNVIVLEGYCDVRGSDEYNLALGQRRAKSVKSYLVGAGVSPKMIQTVSKGETERWGAGTSESAYQQNRRVHFVPYKK